MTAIEVKLDNLHIQLMKKNPLLFLATLLFVAVSTMFVACSSDDDNTSNTNNVTPADSINTQKPDSTSQQPTAPKAAVGWPAQYGGVMLQAFYWDSYDDTQWSVLNGQADELAQYFQLVWVPNSGMTSDYYHSKRQTMGYDPCFWLDHTSAFGTEAQLRQLIQTLKAKGTGVIEDVVVNHKNGLTSWTDFPNESKNGYSLTWDNTTFSAICQNDECNSHGYKTTGAKDTGDNFDGYRDLDHTNATVQQNVTTYLNFLLKDLGYAGFRYDMVKGYSAKYVGQYNQATQPAYSVGECWDGSVSVVRNWIDGTKHTDGTIQSAAFDFPMKYQINRAFENGQWASLRNTMLTTTSGYARYSVTFVDNHDTGKNSIGTSDGPLTKNIAAANAYILTMPGTPCVWLRHWQDYKGTVKRLIAVRQAVGINNESTFTVSTASSTGYVLGVKGTKGTALLLLGEATTDVSDYMLAVEGLNYKLYVSKGTDLTAVKAVTDADAAGDETAEVVIPDFCTVSAGETCAFFESASSWSKVTCWAWDNKQNYTGGTWPGQECTKIGTASNGNTVWKWVYTGTLTTQPAQIIFSNDGSSQTADLTFQNGGYYNRNGLQGTVTATAQ